MKLYLSSYRLGDHPEELLRLLSKNKTAAVIVNAIDDETKAIRNEKLQKEFEDLKNLGITPEEIDLREFFGKEEELKKKISAYGMVWVRGGNTFILRRAFAYSGFDDILKEKINDKNFVYAGYSAGICVLSSTMKGLHIVDDSHIVPQGYKQEVIWEGVGLVPYTFAPHYQSDHVESVLVDESINYMEKNNIPFKTLRDGEVLIAEV